MSRFRVAVHIVPAPRPPRSAGQGRRRRAPHARLRRRARRARRPPPRRRDSTPATPRAAETAAREMCERLLANPVTEDFEIAERGGRRMKFGIVTFPGSNCDYDAYQRGRRDARRGSRVPLAQGPRPAAMRRRSSCPAASATATTCAPARSRASARSCTRSSRTPNAAARCSASATASRSPARRACCPARCCATRASSSSASWSRLRVENADTMFTNRYEQGPAASRFPSPMATGATPRTTRRSSDSRARAASSSATWAARGDADEWWSPNGSMRAIAGIVNDERQRAGHDAASGARRRSAARLAPTASECSSRCSPRVAA